jgi:hypothetical protein
MTTISQVKEVIDLIDMNSTRSKHLKKGSLDFSVSNPNNNNFKNGTETRNPLAMSYVNQL